MCSVGEFALQQDPLDYPDTNSVLGVSFRNLNTIGIKSKHSFRFKFLFLLSRGLKEQKNKQKSNFLVPSFKWLPSPSSSPVSCQKEGRSPELILIADTSTCEWEISIFNVCIKASDTAFFLIYVLFADACLIRSGPHFCDLLEFH